MTVLDDPGANLLQLEAMAESFDAYLDQASPYRDVAVQDPGDGARVMTMSIGLVLDLIEALERGEDELQPGERDRLAGARRTIRALRHGRPKDYERLLLRELKSQLDAWRWYLEDCERGARGCREAYGSESRKRTRIEQLLADADAVGADAAEARGRVARLDRQLRGLLEPGPFAGPAGTETRYPRKTHWWLYGRPAQRRRDG